MRYIICKLFVLMSFVSSFAQFERLEKSDSLFKKYVVPVIDKNIYQRLKSEDAVIYMGCFFKTDTSGKITFSKFVPFFEIGNTYTEKDSIWEAIKQSLIKSSKNWVFKSFLWPLKEKNKLGEDKINNNPVQRPFTGKPRFFLIFEISADRLVTIDKISFLNYFKIE